MPLQRGSSQKTISSNIRELHQGPNYAKTAAKHGKATANRQAIAIALGEARKGRAMGGMVPPVLGLGQGGQLAGAPMGLAGLGAALAPAAQNNAPTGFSGLMQAPGVRVRAFGGPLRGAGIVKTPTMTPTWQERQEARTMTRGPILSHVPGRTDAHATHVPSGSYVIPADIVSGRGQGNTLAGTQTLQKLFRMGPYGGAMPAMARSRGFPRVGLPKPGKFVAQGGKAGEHVGKPVRVNLAGGEIVVPPENLMAVVHPNLKTAHEIMDRWVLNERKKLRKVLAKLPGPARD